MAVCHIHLQFYFIVFPCKIQREVGVVNVLSLQITFKLIFRGDLILPYRHIYPYIFYSVAFVQSSRLLLNFFAFFSLNSRARKIVIRFIERRKVSRGIIMLKIDICLLFNWYLRV